MVGIEVAGARLSRTGICTTVDRLVGGLRKNGIDVVTFDAAVSQKTYLPWLQCCLLYRVKVSPVDCMVFPTNMMPCIWLDSIPAVVIVHDVIWRRFPEEYHYLWRLGLTLGVRTALRGATVVVPSNATADAVRREFPTKNRLSVMPWGADVGVPIDVPVQRGRDVIYLGTLIGHKDVTTLIRAMVRVRAVYGDAHLTILGDGPARRTLEVLRDELALRTTITFLGWVNEEQKKLWFERARVMAVPSLEEGYSLTPWEAVRHGVQLALSDISVHRAFSGNATFFAPGDVSQCAAAIIAELTIRRRPQVQIPWTWDSYVASFMDLLRLAD